MLYEVKNDDIYKDMLHDMDLFDGLLKTQLYKVEIYIYFNLV